MADEVDTKTGWTRLFHPKGPQVTIPVTQEPLNYKMMLDNISAMLEAGFLVTAPGLDEGEEKEQVGYVLRGAHEKEGEITPFVLLYSLNDALTYSFLKVYLNDQMHIEAFEYASKMKLNDLPDYVGNDKPQRGASSKTDRFIIKAPKPFGVVFKKNPKHDDTEAGKMKPARLFVRWEEQNPNIKKAEPADTRSLYVKTMEMLEKSASQGEAALKVVMDALSEPAWEAVKDKKDVLKRMAKEADAKRTSK